jgi:cytochrome b
MKRILVWDSPTRLFHWLFAASFVVAWLTSDSDRWLSIHVFAGYLMLGLIGFRLIWGLVGGHYARFASFMYGPKAALAYARQLLAGQARRYLAHNPAGSQAVFLLLIFGLVVCLTGVFTQGGEEQHGLAARLVGIEAGTKIKSAHEITAMLMLVLVFAHLAGVAIESWLHRENLPMAMITGMKDARAGEPASKPYRRVGGLMLAGVAGFGGWWFFYAIHEPVEKLTGHDDAAMEAPHVAFVGAKLPDDPTWREECGGCHLAFHPNLLPSRSWVRMMAEQASHFGTDLALDAPTREAVLEFLVRNAAEYSSTEAAFKINRSLAANATPLRITETPYWVDKHREITEADWRQPKVKSKVNCAACHVDAEAGTFEDAAMRRPR